MTQELSLYELICEYFKGKGKVIAPVQPGNGQVLNQQKPQPDQQQTPTMQKTSDQQPTSTTQKTSDQQQTIPEAKTPDQQQTIAEAKTPDQQQTPNQQ